MTPVSPEFQFAAPAWLWAVALAPLVPIAAALAGAGARRTARAFGAEPRPGRALAVVRTLLLTLAVALLALALARPRTDPREIRTEVRGRDIVILLDASRSMLAEDLAPNRLDRAKLWIRDLVAARPDDRVAIIAFAGAAQIRCPLTLDRAFFDLAMEEITPDTVPRGGSMIGDAIRKAVADAIPPDAPAGSVDMLIITDGEDQGSLPLDAAAAAAERGVRIITLGIGSDAGTTIPDPDTGGIIRQRGQPVRTALNADQLAAIAAQTPGGAFLNVGTGNIRLDRAYDDLTRGLPEARTGEAAVRIYAERFMIPLAGACTTLALATIIPGRRP